MPILLLAAATVLRVAIPSFAVDRAPQFLNQKMADDYASALAQLQCAEAVSLPATRPQLDRATADCDGSSACIAELARSAAFDWVLVGHLEKMDDRYDTRFKLIEVRDFTARRSFSTQFTGTLSGLSQSIHGFAPVICQKMNPAWVSSAKVQAAQEAAELQFDDTPPPPGKTTPAAPLPLGLSLDDIPLAPPAPVCATKPSPGDKSKAMATFRKGKQEMDAGHFKESLALFEEAHCGFPAPALRRAISEAQLRLGQCEAAQASADKWGDEAVGDERASVAPWLDQIRSSCVSTSITLQPADARLTVDGEARTSSEGRWSARLLVGSHTIRVERAGFKPQELQFRAVSSSPASTTISLVPERAPPPSVAVIEAPPARPPAVTAPPRPTQPPPALAPKEEPVAVTPVPVEPARRADLGWVPWLPAGVAVVGLGLAIAGGVLAAQCPSTAISPDALYDAQVCQANHATLADVGWGIAGAGAVTAGVLFLVLRNNPAPAHESSPVQVGMTGNGLQVSGRF